MDAYFLCAKWTLILNAKWTLILFEIIYQRNGRLFLIIVDILMFNVISTNNIYNKICARNRNMYDLRATYCIHYEHNKIIKPRMI